MKFIQIFFLNPYKTVDKHRNNRYNFIDISEESRQYLPMKECKETIQISKAALARMPGYLIYLKNRRAEGVNFISSTVMAEDLKQNPVQVRKDLAVVSHCPGKPKLGFEIGGLISDIEDFLGYNNTSEAVIVGVGQLGKTLLSYGGFESYGLSIVAGFDARPDVAGKEWCGKKIFSVDRFSELVRRMNILIGIITVPKEQAQIVCDMMIDAGIRAIWNFAPAHLVIPEGIAVKNEDLAASLALLSKQLRDQLGK